MRILLVDPPFKRFTGLANYYFPLGLAYIAAACFEAGHDPIIYDADATKKSSDINFTEDYARMDYFVREIVKPANQAWDELRLVMEHFKPDVVGITAMTTKVASAYKTADHIKRIDPSLPVIMGGPHPTAMPEEVLRYGSIDYVIRDEGERSLVSLLGILSSSSASKPSDEDLESIPNLSYRVDGETRNNPSAPFIKDLDSIPRPRRSALLHMDEYSTEDLGLLLTSRGCPFRCTYCYHPWRGRVNFRSAGDVLEEMLHLYHNYGVRQFAIKDDSFTVRRSHVEAICQGIIDAKIKIIWDCTTRPNIIDKELLEIMIRAGCSVIKIGVETGSQRILDICNRGTTFEQVRKAARLFNEKGIFWSGYFMMGIPQEREEDIEATLSFMRELRPHYAGLGVYEPFPNTVLFDDAVEMDLIHETVPIDHYFSTNPKDYYFKDPQLRVLEIAPDRFEQLTRKMMREFHNHNTKVSAMMRRGWARRRAYTKDTSLLIGDIKKAITWKRAN